MPITLEYPSDLPLPVSRLSNTNSINSAQGNPDAGPPASFKWTDQEFITFDLTWSLTQDQAYRLLFFFNQYGLLTTRWFLMDLQWNVDTAGDTRKLECNFNGAKPNVATVGKRRVVTSSIIARNPQRDTRDFYDQYINLVIVDNLENVIDRLEIFSNVDMPEVL